MPKKSFPECLLCLLLKHYDRCRCKLVYERFKPSFGIGSFIISWVSLWQLFCAAARTCFYSLIPDYPKSLEKIHFNQKNDIEIHRA